MPYELETWHYLLNHFPISLFIIGYLFNSFDFFKKNDFYAKFGDVNMFLGVLFGVITIISGFFTDSLIGHMEYPFPVWTTHGTHMIISIVLFFTLLLFKYFYPNKRYVFYIHTIILIFFIHGAHIGAKLADRF